MRKINNETLKDMIPSFYRYNGKIIKVEDKNGSRTKYIVTMRTYLHLSGDLVIIEWDNSEVKYTTKLNHPELENWTSKMYWKGVYSESQKELKVQKEKNSEKNSEVNT